MAFLRGCHCFAAIGLGVLLLISSAATAASWECQEEARTAFEARLVVQPHVRLRNIASPTIDHGSTNLIAANTRLSAALLPADVTAASYLIGSGIKLLL